MTTSFAQSAIAVLIDLAQRNEIDPWDVQVVEVFDRFLSELALTDPRDLSRSGQAFLYASMLILLKSDSLVNAEQTAETEEPFEDLDPDQALADDRNLPSKLERLLQRRAVAPAPQRRRVTLNELISQLELMAVTVEGKQATAGRARNVKPRPSRAQAARAIAHLAHQENLAEVAAELEQFLADRWPQISQRHDWLDLPHLLEFKDDRVGVFWALLFLCAQSKVELSQTEFYQDLKLRPLAMEVLNG